MIAIHDSVHGFHPAWAAYCQEQGIPFRRVNCHASDIVAQLEDCTALMWHHSHSHPADILAAKPLLFALEHAGKVVFPDFRTGWHFDDKLAQKYLFEALGIDAAPAYVFTDRAAALAWAAKTSYPKVFKLRRGAASAGVRLVRNETQARQLIRQAFVRGFSVYDPLGNLRERLSKYRRGKAGLADVLKGVARLAQPPRFSKVLGRERGYAYFQEFIPGNDSDQRVVVIGDRAFGMRRYVRPGDFRASGSGLSQYGEAAVDRRCIAHAFEVAKRTGAYCLAMDFVIDGRRGPLLIEFSYGFRSRHHGYAEFEGYWDSSLNWHSGPINPPAWMVDQVLAKAAESCPTGFVDPVNVLLQVSSLHSG